MTAATVARRSIAELTFARADDLLNVVHYTSVSASGANGPTNHTALDVITGGVLCSCKGTECGRRCWHADLVADAWEAHPARLLARQYTDAQLVHEGARWANFCRVYRRRAWRCLPDHQVALVACRQEFIARRKPAGGVALGEPVAA